METLRAKTKELLNFKPNEIQKQKLNNTNATHNRDKHKR